MRSPAGAVTVVSVAILLVVPAPVAAQEDTTTYIEEEAPYRVELRANDQLITGGVLHLAWQVLDNATNETAAVDRIPINATFLDAGSGFIRGVDRVLADENGTWEDTFHVPGNAALLVLTLYLPQARVIFHLPIQTSSVPDQEFGEGEDNFIPGAPVALLAIAMAVAAAVRPPRRKA